jgi:hypothetical protein
VTIAIGMCTTEGIVLCSDSQITGPGYKYQEPKIQSMDLYGKADWSLALAYSGDPEKMTSLCERMDSCVSQNDAVVDSRYVKASFETAISEVRNTIVTHSDPDIDALCGFLDRDGIPIQFTGKNGVVSESAKWSILGVGDTSLTRYLQKILPIHRSLESIGTALAVGAYIVKQASDYIDGCGGNLQACILRPNFRPYDLHGMKQTAIKYIDELIDNVLRRALLCASGIELLSDLDHARDKSPEENLIEEIHRARAQINSLKV